MCVIRDAPAEFAALRGEKILIYWPHGFGDWIFLSYILPLLEPSNEYFLTRIGDHNTSIFEGATVGKPLYAGGNELNSSKWLPAGVEHFGMRREPGGGERDVLLPAAVARACEEHKVDILADLGFWEVYGAREWPWHTKARNMAKGLLSPARRQSIQADLGRPLRSSLSFAAPSAVRRIVEARLRSELDVGRRKFCVITRNGYTNCDKNWGHLWRDESPARRLREGDECRDFIRLMHSRGWSFLVLEDRLFRGDDTVRDRELRYASYAELFGSLDSAGIPFGFVAKALVELADLVVGVPAGLFHLAQAHPSVPVIGVWTTFHPSWWDEPKANSRHVLGRSVVESGRAALPGSFDKRGEMQLAIRTLDTRIVPGEAVFEEVEMLGL